MINASDRNSTNNVNIVSSTVNTVGIEVNAVSSNISIELPNDPNMPKLEDIVYSDDYEDRTHKGNSCIEGFLSSIEAMQDELLQFKLQKVWTLVDLPNGKRAIGTKWVYRNKKDERDPDFPDNVSERKYRQVFVIRIGIKMSSMGELTFFLGLQVKQKEDGIFISQDKYVTEILKKFGFTESRSKAHTYGNQKPFAQGTEMMKRSERFNYMSIDWFILYLNSSRPDIMFVVCACARYQVNPKVSHLHAMKRIFRL
ncbi:hypothetical protein Tco_1254904 [Tanacetum coccineum]